MLTQDQMTKLFAPVSRPYRHLLGFEYEIQCFQQQTGAPLAYQGPGGLKEILEHAAALTKGELLAGTGEPPTKVVLPERGLLSLEPGGQLEFSSAPTESFDGTIQQLRWYLDLLDELRQRFELHLFYGGINPVHTPHQIGLVTPTRRYQIMDSYLQKSGSMGRRMMRQTCSVQVTFDYQTQRQGEDLLRTAQFVAPFAAAIFANSPYLDGRPTGYRSYRPTIWSNTDPTRCGCLPGFTRPDYGFGSYLDHVNKAPLFFVQTEAGLEQAPVGLTFCRLNQQGLDGRPTTIEDFVLHNSTIFTDVRLKHTVEVRTVDSQDPALLPSVLALLAGILHCERSRLRACHLLGKLTEGDYWAMTDRLGREGISGQLNGLSMREVALELIDLSAQGLPSCFKDGDDAVAHLDPIRELVRQGKTPADLVTERFGDDAAGWLSAGRAPIL
jgi:glutamate--cysteine ligase